MNYTHKLVATTRFNSKTYEENENYRLRICPSGSIYGTPMKMADKIPLESLVYVIEMNNSTNKIEGIGIIYNRPVLNRRHRIYDDMDYNRYIYKGKKRISIMDITDDYNKQVIVVLEQLLFKGASHCKRAQGITALPDWIVHNRFGFNFTECISKLCDMYDR
mgnify:CR=1 FL=1|jgi:hypothetical protein